MPMTQPNSTGPHLSRHRRDYDIRGTLFGSLLQGDPTVWFLCFNQGLSSTPKCTASEHLLLIAHREHFLFTAGLSATSVLEQSSAPPAVLLHEYDMALSVNLTRRAQRCLQKDRQGFMVASKGQHLTKTRDAMQTSDVLRLYTFPPPRPLGQIPQHGNS